ncbi:putative 1-phosphatidylinositol 4,5-bisphosphate phosphodiesterase [Sesbania bispinosa]|nr:putative 1-phosphatidylinositol 4,5-bisphosphate phosphodiesterase [Sesbania bispinosa]
MSPFQFNLYAFITLKRYSHKQKKRNRAVPHHRRRPAAAPSPFPVVYTVIAPRCCVKRPPPLLLGRHSLLRCHHVRRATGHDIPEVRNADADEK